MISSSPRFCPKCDQPTKVVKTNHATGQIIRYRLCLTCGHRYRTKEILLAGPPIHHAANPTGKQGANAPCNQ